MRVAPLWTALDSNHDGSLAASEISASAERLGTLDEDEDGWVTESELTGGVTQLTDSWRSTRLVTVLNHATNWKQLRRELQTLSGSEAGTAVPTMLTTLLSAMNVTDLAELTQQQISELIEAAPHLTLTVQFESENTDNRRFSVVSVQEELLALNSPVSATDDVISLQLPGCVVELTAVQRTGGKSLSSSGGQVAVGAVVDGFPLLRQADDDNDRRLSVREIEAFLQLLPQLDTDGDGIIQQNEIRIPIRLTITQGALVHEILNRPVSAPARHAPQDTSDAPDWFASMDRNSDAELTPAEFPGTQDQFDQLDTDGNRRISIREAIASEN